LSAHELNFTKVAKTSDIPAGKMKAVKIGDKDILVANVGGVFYAIADRCSHEGGRLSAGTLEGGVVTCPLHGSKFDVRTGKSVSGSKFMFFRSKVGDLPSYEVKVEGDDVMVFQRSIWGM
jgi:3-phenylpropionate/trans-cinnamate dioxygenase ferredoxin subunit